MALFEREFDLIVVGAGSAGCAVAARASERSSRQVLLVEAGIDQLPGEELPEVRDLFPRSFCNPDLLWLGLKAEMKEPPAGGTAVETLFEQGKLVGGGSNLMGMSALRGAPDDFDEWEELGAKRWGWEGVIPFFKRLERDTDFAGPLHGQSGPVTVRRYPPEQWPPLAQALGRTFGRRWPFIPDLNGQFGDGWGPMPMSSVPEGRVSSSMAYLTKSARLRPNLSIETKTLATRILFDGNRVQGLEAQQTGRLVRWKAREIVVCSGALHTPALLQRSGIGDGPALQALGIGVVANLRGVGLNLSNHARVYVSAHLRPNARQPFGHSPLNHCALRYSSGLEGCPSTDMQLVILNRTYWHKLGESICGLGPTVYKPFSRGDVMIRSADPLEEPRVRFRLASDERDLGRLTAGLQFALQLLNDVEVKPLRNEMFIPRGSKWLRRIQWLGKSSELQAIVAAAILDNAGPMRSKFIQSFGILPDGLPNNSSDLRNAVFNIVGHMYHPAGTCRLGSLGDPEAVVDSYGRVFGVEGLLIADASVMPSLPRGNTNIPAIMIGEKVSDSLNLPRPT